MSRIFNVDKREWRRAYKASDLGEMKRLIMKNKEIINSKEDDGNTALIHAAYNRNICMVNFLIKFKADVNLQNNNGASALMSALYDNCLPLMEHYISVGNNENLLRSFKVSRLAGIEIAKILIKAGADLNLQSNKHTPIMTLKETETVLMRSVENKDTEVIKMLVQSGADVFIKDHKERTCLHYTLHNNNIELADYFVNQGLSFETCKHEDYKKIKQTTHDYFEDYEGYKEYRMINEQE